MLSFLEILSIAFCEVSVQFLLPAMWTIFSGLPVQPWYNITVYVLIRDNIISGTDRNPSQIDIETIESCYCTLANQ